MEGEEGGGIRLSKRFSDQGGGGGGGGEVDYKTKSGTAWSHSYLNQKPWHPLSYPNQRRKWIAEQIQNQRQRRTEEVSREYAQEQEFFRQTALVSKKDKEKIEMMKAVSFMYVRPPGYNAESAKAAEIADESIREHPDNGDGPSPSTSTSTSRPRPPESMPPTGEEAKKPRPKDVFGRPLPTEQEFEILKNAPRLETGAPARAKPFGVEVRNVKCVRCGTFGHQSGDRECPLKDVIMPNEESRLKRDDPLTAILAHTDPSEPLKWELKQKPGISPPRGGFKQDDPNQQIVAEDIFDEYGGFLGGDVIPELLTNFSSKPRNKSSKKTKRKKKQSSPVSGEDGLSSSWEDDKKRSKKRICKVKKKKRSHSESSSSETELDRHKRKTSDKQSYSVENPNHEKHHRSTKNRQKRSHSSEDTEIYRHNIKEKSRDRCTNSSEDSEPDKHHSGAMSRRTHSFSLEDSFQEKHHRSRKIREKYSHSHEDSKFDRHYRRDKSRDRSNKSFAVSEPDRHHRSAKSRHRNSYSSSEDSEPDRDHRSLKSGHRHSYSSEDSELDRHHTSVKSRHHHSYSSEDSDTDRRNRNKRSRDRHSDLYGETKKEKNLKSRNSRRHKQSYI